MKFKLIEKKDLLIVLFLCSFLPLFIYNLHVASLEDYDEAWYAVIARNILSTKNPFLLSFNEKSYADHPPLGFQLMAASIAIFGSNEFAVRFPSALLGFSSPIILYFIGKKLFNRFVGFGASLVLVSCVWFIFRARSGNLDSILLFFYLLTFLMAIKINQSYKWIYPFAISFALLFMSKSLIGATIIVPVLTYFAVNRFLPKKILLSLCLFLLTISPWFLINFQKYGVDFLSQLLSTGLKRGNTHDVNILQITNSLTFTYLHFGILRWYFPAIIAAIGSLGFLFRHKNLAVLYAWTAVLLYGFLKNAKTEIWHLIPLYPPLALFIAFFFWKITKIAIPLFLRFTNVGNKKVASVLGILAIIPIVILCFYQIYKFKDQIKIFGQTKSGLAVTSRSAKNYQEKLYLDSDLFVPGVAQFYSEKEVFMIRYNPEPTNTLSGLITYGQKPLLLLTEKYKVDLAQVNPGEYKILSEEKGHVLLYID